MSKNYNSTSLCASAVPAVTWSSSPSCYVLTLAANSESRQANCRQQLEALGAKWQFVYGVLAKEPIVDEAYSPLQNRLYYNRPMTQGEKSVYLGHRKIWQTILASDAPYAIVLEDDFSIKDRQQFQAVIEDAIAAAARWDVIKLYESQHKPVCGSFRSNQTNFVFYRYPTWGMVAYLINRQAAERLLARPRVFRPVDDDLAHPWEFGLRVFSAAPSPVEEIAPQLGGSLLEQQRSISQKKPRNVVRSLHGNTLMAYKHLRAAGWRCVMRRAAAGEATGRSCPPE
jgi:glycosyl transferase, family 25